MTLRSVKNCTQTNSSNSLLLTFYNIKLDLLNFIENILKYYIIRAYPQTNICDQ